MGSRIIVLGLFSLSFYHSVPMKNNNKTPVVEQEKTIYTTKDISLHDCTIIVQRIHEENKIHGHHMLEYTAEELFHEISIGSYSGIKDNDMLIWCIKLTPVQKNWLIVFERGSLFIHKDYRNQGLWKHLVESILNDNKTLPIYSVTNVEAVKKNQ